MNDAGLSAPELGTQAFENLLATIDEAIENKQVRWGQVKNRVPLGNHLFAELAYTTLIYSGTDELGWERLNYIIDEYVSEPFAAGVHTALSIIDKELIHGLLTGVQPYMLKGLCDTDHWNRLLKDQRSKPLITLVDVSPSIAISIGEVFEIFLGDRLLVDYTAAESGSVALIFALAFEPDLMFVDILLLGISGIDLMWFVQKRLSPRHMPYFVVTAEIPYTKPANLRDTVFYEQAMKVFCKPFEIGEILQSVENMFKLSGLIKE